VPAASETSDTAEPATGGAAPSTSRLAGRDRIETAVLVSRRAFPRAFTSGGSVYLARSDVFADAVAAGTLTDGPILLVPTCGTAPRSVVQETARLDPARVVALGGTGAVCDAVLKAVAGGRPRARLAGADRHDTAIAIAHERARRGAVTEVYVADGDGGPDPVVGGQLTRGPILLTTRHKDVTGKLKAAIDHLKPARVVALGGSSVVSDASLDALAAGHQRGRLGGGDRFGSAAAVAGREFPTDSRVVYLARGDVYADAVAAGSLRDGPLLLVNTCDLPAAARERIAYARPAAVIALGGSSVVCDAVLEAATRATTTSGGRNVAVDQDRTGWSPDMDVAEDLGISSDGRFVVFRGDASALLPAGSVPAGTSRSLLLRDRSTGSIELVSVTSAGAPFAPERGYGSPAGRPAISDDGRYIAYSTDSPDRDLGDTNEGGDIYLRDRLLGTTRLVSGVDGAAGGGTWAAISRDGRYVFFHSYAPLTKDETDRVADVFRYSVADGTLVRVSTNAAGEGGNGGSYVASPSSDGRHVAFQSVATNLVDGDTNGKSDVFIKDMQTGAVVRASVHAGQQGDGNSSIPSLSGDGSRVVFLSKSKNFGSAPSYHDQVFLWQRDGMKLTWVSRTPSGAAFNQPVIAHLSGDGSTVVFEAFTRPEGQIWGQLWRYEVSAATPAVVSTGYDGDPTAVGYAASAVSFDGRKVVFPGGSATSASDSMSVVVWEKSAG
jgi:Tol biopolymer transport system component/putative cell wall-binding protein